MMIAGKGERMVNISGTGGRIWAAVGSFKSLKKELSERPNTSRNGMGVPEV
jgi:hypothetical protein